MDNNSRFSNLDIIVVGAGMVGLTAAIALHQQGFKVLVVEGRDESLLSLPERLTDLKTQTADIESYDNRVSALTRASENILRNIGAWQKIAAMRVAPYQKMQVWDGDGTGEISFSSAQLHQPNLGHIVENSVAIAALIATARDMNLDILCSTKVVGLTEPDKGTRILSCETNTVGNDGESLNLSAKLVIGADGAMSKVRQLAAIGLWQWDYGHHAIVATLKTQKPHQATAWQRFTSDGPLAFLPLADKHTSSIVFSTSPEHAKRLMALDCAAFKQVLAREFELTLDAVTQVSKRAVFPLRQRHAKQYVQQGLVLIGDACHTIHPLAGQGVNLGLLDVASLVQVLIAARARKQDIAQERVLKQFQRERHADNLKMSATMQGFKWLFDPQPAPLIIARNIGMKLFNKATPVKQHVMAQAMGLSGKLPELARI